MINIKTYIPQDLQPFVKSFWFMEVDTTGDNVYEEEIIPDGHHEIIFHLNSDAASRKPHDSGWMAEPSAFVAGQTLKSYRLQMSKGSKLYGIRFYN